MYDTADIMGPEGVAASLEHSERDVVSTGEKLDPGIFEGTGDVVCRGGFAGGAGSPAPEGRKVFDGSPHIRGLFVIVEFTV